MPTSGTGSLWRILNLIAGAAYTPSKICEQMEIAGRGAEIPAWQPEANGFLYMYNTPNYLNANLADPSVRLITNFRDPRDLACNQYHWALQHPILNRTEAEIAQIRANVAAKGIDQFVAEKDNNILFKSLRGLSERVQANDPNVLKLSYAQLCLDFDNLLERIIEFFGADRNALPWDRLEQERTVNLAKNPNWIGQIWSGSDILPGRYRSELSRETVAIIDDKYRENLKFLRSLEVPRLRFLLATEAERLEMDRVLVGNGDELFLKNDANNTVAQITGEMKLGRDVLTRIAMAHKSRQVFGALGADFAYHHAIIPCKEVAHKALLPAEIGFEGQGPRPIGQYAANGLGAVWQPFYEPSLLEPTEAGRFFPATDSHWNHEGAIRYLRGGLARVNPKLAGRLDAVELKRFAGRQQGDLGLKLEMGPEVIEIVAPQRGTARPVFENGIQNEGCVRWYRNEAQPEAPRALVMHDSFTMWLLGLLPELFSEVVFFHGTVFDYEFTRRFAPDIVLCLQAERFFVRVPETGGDLRAYVRQEETDKKAAKSFAEFLAAEPRFAGW